MMAVPFQRSRANSRTSQVSLEEDERYAHTDSYLRELTSPAEPNIDIVAVHGLNFLGKSDHGKNTWSKNGVLWLQDEKFFPGRFPSARVMLFSYNSRVMAGTSGASVLDVATELLNRLISKRRDNPFRPILFLCHSLGGIVVKQALLRSVHSSRYTPIMQSTKAIAFFGTPHRGGRHADLGSVIASICLTFSGALKNNFMETLRQGSTSADIIHELFIEHALDFRIVSFFETLPYTTRSGVIVEKRSATLGLPDFCETAIKTDANHSDICKFDRRDPRYELVIDNIAELVRHAVRRTSQGMSLLTPTISIVDAQNRRRTLSMGSESSGPSWYHPDSAGNSSRESLHVGMPTFPDDEENRIQTSSPDIMPSQPIIMLPYNSNPDFIGRDKLFEQIKDSFKPTPSLGQGRVALYGLGGVGKSQLAIRFAYWYRQNFPDHSIFWIHCGTAARFRQGLVEIGTKCRVPAFSNRNRNQLMLLKEWLQRNGDFKWLLILDNADDQNIFQESSDGEDLSSYIPDCETGSVLITTRDFVVGRRLANGRAPLQVDKMPREEAVRMLRAQISSRIPSEALSPATPASFQGPVHDSDLLKLAHALDYLPLAMVQAAGFIMESSISVRRYLNMFEDDASAVELLQRSVEQGVHNSDVPNSVYATWKLSIAQIQERYPKSAELIFLMAHYEQLQIPLSLLEHHIGHNAVEVRATIGVLLRFSLIVAGRKGNYNMHRLVQLIVKQWLEAASTDDEWKSRSLQLLASHFPSGDFETWALCASLETHAVKMISTPGIKDRDKPFLGTLQNNLAWYLSTRGRWVSAEEYARAACLTFQECHGLRHRETLAAKSNLVRILKLNGKVDEAELIIEQVVNETKALVGTKDEQYFDALDLFALIAQIRGNLSLGENVVRKSLAGREKHLNAHHPGLFRSLGRLATILEYSGKYNEAEIAITRALQGQKHLIGTGDKTTLMILQRLAFIQRAQGRYQEAEETARDFLEGHIKAYGPKHIDTQEARYSLAGALAANGKLDEAEEILLYLVETIKKDQPFDANHQYNFFVQNALGGINFKRGKYSLATQHLEIAWLGLKKIYQDHMKTFEYQSVYAAALLRSDPVANFEEASKLQQQACAGLKRLQGADHPSTLSAYIFLSEVFLHKGDYLQAIKFARKAAKGREKVLNKDHPDICLAKEWLLHVESKENVNIKLPATAPQSLITSKDHTQKKRRSYLGLRKLVSSSSISTGVFSQVDKDDEFDEKGLDEKDLEKVDTKQSRPEEKKHRRWFTKADDSKESRKDSTGVTGMETDSDDDDKEGSLDYEKSAAYTTHPPVPASRIQNGTPPLVTGSGSTQDPSPIQALSRKRSEAMAQAIREHDKKIFESRSQQRPSGIQTWPTAKDDDAVTAVPIRRKPVTPRTASHIHERQQVEAVDGGELPAEVPVHPAARLDGPGWDDQPFSA